MCAQAYNPPDFTPGPETMNPWTDPAVKDDVAIPYVLETGSLYGSPKRVREQVAEIADAGVQHLLCQTGFGAMSQEQISPRCGVSASKSCRHSGRKWCRSPHGPGTADRHLQADLRDHQPVRHVLGHDGRARHAQDAPARRLEPALLLQHRRHRGARASCSHPAPSARRPTSAGSCWACWRSACSCSTPRR